MMTFEVWSRERFGEDICCVIRAGTVLNGNGMIVDLFDEVVDADKEMPDTFHISRELGGESDEALVVDKEGSGLGLGETKFVKEIAEVDDIFGYLGSC